MTVALASEREGPLTRCTFDCAFSVPTREGESHGIDRNAVGRWGGQQVRRLAHRNPLTVASSVMGRQLLNSVCNAGTRQHRLPSSSIAASTAGELNVRCDSPGRDAGGTPAASETSATAHAADGSHIRI